MAFVPSGGPCQGSPLDEDGAICKGYPLRMAPSEELWQAAASMSTCSLPQHHAC